MRANGADDHTWGVQLLNGEDECFRVVWVKVSVHPGSGSGMVFIDFANRSGDHHFRLGSKDVELNNIFNREGTE
jgi:hypothetical protein